MTENILDIYNKLYQYTLEMTAAIEEKNWEQVNVLASHREELFQKINVFAAEQNECDEDLKRQLTSILEKIKAQDDANLKSALNKRVEMNKLKAQYNMSNRVLKAYNHSEGRYGRSVDRHT